VLTKDKVTHYVLVHPVHVNVLLAHPVYLQDVCEVLKNAVRTLLSDCASLLSTITQLIILIFQSHSHPVIFDISKQVTVTLLL